MPELRLDHYVAIHKYLDLIAKASKQKRKK